MYAQLITTTSFSAIEVIIMDSEPANLKPQLRIHA